MNGAWFRYLATVWRFQMERLGYDLYYDDDCEVTR